jgi:hypothetical protein
MAEKSKLPGWVYMIAGLIIMGYTKFIQLKQPTSKIGFFFWVGLVFLVIGILREFVPRLRAKKPRQEQAGPPPQRQHQQGQAHPAAHKYNTSPHATHQHTTPAQHPSHPYQPLHKQCPRCHILTHGQGKYCHNCGHQFY